MDIKTIYEKHYKLLLVLPYIVLLFAIIQIAYQTAHTGDFMYKDVSLKGGMTITIPLDGEFSIEQAAAAMQSAFPGHDISVRNLRQGGQITAAIIESDIPDSQAQDVIAEASKFFGRTWQKNEYSVEVFGSSLSNSFFKQTMVSVLLAFSLMGIVVFLYFKSTIPSAAVIIAALCDMIETIAIMNVLGTRISTAGIAAYLMLIGYSIDTDILLTTRVLKRKSGTVMDQVYASLKTGVMMNVVALSAATAALILSQSPTISQIMLILIVGILCDLLNTWIHNVGILRWYLERKGQHD